MTANNGLPLITPRVVPPLDPDFRPAVLANHFFRQSVELTGKALPVGLALERGDGSVSRFETIVAAPDHPQAGGNFTYLERLVKLLLWSRGGARLHIAGPADLAARLAAHYLQSPTGLFDADLMGRRIFERPFEVVHVTSEQLPSARESTAPLGRHLNGCRIGFDLGASDRKVAAVQDGRVVYSDEFVWDPRAQSSPQWHFDQIMEVLKKAAAHLPRVDGIGGSSAGVLVNNRVRVASLFRGVPEELFESRVKNLFLDLQRAWGVPFEVVNDGEVTALAGSMTLGDNAVLGVALGSSQAAGYVTADGGITPWLNELAFAPVDYHPNAPTDEWSGDYGCGVQYFSQQGVNRLIPKARLIEIKSSLPLPEKLVEVQKLMARGDPRAAKIYQTIGVCLGYAVAHYADFYDLRHVLVLGRVTTGQGGELIVEGARQVLREEFDELAARVKLHLPDEKEKRHGQAIAAASLPVVK